MRVLTLASLVGTLACGCAGQRLAVALQPNPNTQPRTEVLPISAKLFIFQRDMHLPRDYQLRSSAQFTVVSRDRLRVHVGITRFFESDADTQGWRAKLVDETGREYLPASREMPRINRINVAWRLYRAGDEFCTKPPCKVRVTPGYDVYQAEADYVFQATEILPKERRSLTLVLDRGDDQYQFQWRFGDGFAVQHYGRTRVDDEMGVMPLPGPDAQIAETRYEGDH